MNHPSISALSTEHATMASRSLILRKITKHSFWVVDAQGSYYNYWLNPIVGGGVRSTLSIAEYMDFLATSLEGKGTHMVVL